MLAYKQNIAASNDLHVSQLSCPWFFPQVNGK